MTVCKVKSVRSAVQKNDAFGCVSCTACTFRNFCNKYCLGCTNGVNERAALGHLRRETIRRTWAVFSDLAPIFGEIILKKEICGTPSAELKAKYLS